MAYSFIPQNELIQFKVLESTKRPIWLMLHASAPEVEPLPDEDLVTEDKIRNAIPFEIVR
jgi:hypothetical protein